MGKKKKDKKGKGAEKTAQKTERKTEKKTKKLVKEQGEEDIEALIAQFKEDDRRKVEVIEEKCPPPSPRCNMSLVGHPEKDELIMFGGQYCNGAKTTMYDEMLVYSIRNDDWTKLSIPNAPPPRCAHQAVVVRQFGGQMWVFGGEFESPKQLQFYHYNDLWCYHIKDRKWEKINAKGGPTARSGHRMVACKRQLIVFGGFYDVGDYKYFNDVYSFNLDTYKWTKIEPSGQAPNPRSGCVMSALQDQMKILIYGGYSRDKVKRDVDQGKTHTDMFLLVPEVKAKEDTGAVSKWKWVVQKQSGVKPTGRCGLAITPTPPNRAIVFGGVMDEDEDEEHMKGVFYNDMYSLELDKGKWHQVEIRGKREKEKKKRRRKKPSESEMDHEVGEESEEDDSDVEDDVKRLKVSENAETTTDDGAGPEKTYDDGIFTVTVGGQASNINVNMGGVEDLDDVVERAGTNEQAAAGVLWPSPRMNAQLAVQGGVLYVYGGVCEDGDKQITLSDFYALDLHKLDTWKVLIKNDADKQEWLESASEDSDDDDDEDNDEGAAAKKQRTHDDSDEEEDDDSDDDDDEDDDDDDDDESDMELGEAPTPKKGEDLDSYYKDNKDYWELRADEVAEKEGLKVSIKQLKKAARKMAEEFFEEHGKK